MGYLKVAMVDDQKMYIEVMKTTLALYSIHVDETALNGTDFLTLLNKNKISSKIILLDVEMPELDGGQVLDILNKEHPHLKVIIMSLYDEKEVVRNFINRGACAYVPKSGDLSILVDAISSVNKLGVYKANLKGLLEQEPRLRKSNEYKMMFSDREREIIYHLCLGRYVREIALELHVAEKTIETHLTNIYKKSETRNKSEFLIRAVKVGLNYLG